MTKLEAIRQRLSYAKSVMRGERTVPREYYVKDVEALLAVADAARELYDEGDDPVDADCVRQNVYEAARKRLGVALAGLEG